MNFNLICTEVSKTSVFFVCFVLKFNKIGEVYAIGGCSSAHRQLEIAETAFYGGWFYYRDVYHKRTLFFGNVYYDVPEKEAGNFVPQRGYKLMQNFDDNTAGRICAEINKQLETAYRWLNNFAKRNSK